jgi:ubiquinone/menaquinone biosynthesis C-methylase UbiE
MDQPMSDFAFSMMSAMFRVRDLLRPRKEILGEVGIKPGFQVLDYGCGPGGYVATAAELVGRSGMVYALDMHPLAIEKVEKIVRKNRLANVKTIRSDCQTGLPDDSIDVVLLYDILHMLSDPHAVLAELRRVLKPDGVLSLNEPHMGEQDVLAAMTNGHTFRLARRGERTYSFMDAAPAAGLAA